VSQKETVQLKKSVLKTKVKCCGLDRDFHPDSPDDFRDGRPNHPYLEGYGSTFIYCPECLSEVRMGSSEELIHLEGCVNTGIGFKGHHKWKHAYKGERECNSPEEYMAQFEVQPGEI
jgi:hypothetical protein